MVKIREIFTSVQGEGPYIGKKQLFIRLCNCNLKCKYCDTDYNSNLAKEYSIEEIQDICTKNADCHSISITGGEPLLHTNFIKELSCITSLPIYLETNGTLYKELSEIINSVEYVAADIKLPSTTGMKPFWEEHDKFFSIAANKNLFVKAVFDKNITQEEITEITKLCKKYKIELILQPMMIGNNFSITSDFMLEVLNTALSEYKNVRLIPQVHKFINIA